MNPPTDRQSHLREAIEQTALDSMGTLSLADDNSWVREHLANDCPVCREAADRVANVFDHLLFLARPVQPAPAVRERVLEGIRTRREVAQDQSAPTREANDASPAAPASAARDATGSKPGDSPIQVWNRWPATDAKFFTLASSENDWQDTTVEGIRARVLRVDEDRDEVTMLVRMDPGTSYPSHRHGGDEQCYVLQGDLQVEDQLMQAGDYQFAPAGSIHGVQSTKQGCTLLLVSSRSDEILAG